MQSEDLPSVSVIVPSKNAAHLITECLQSVRAAHYPKDKLEIILVDNGSVDTTVEIALPLVDKSYVVKDVSIGALRNKGASHASGDILAFLDSDCLAKEQWLLNGVRTVMTYGGVTGANHELPEDPTWVEKVWFSQTDTGIHEVTHIPSGNLFISADLFKKVSGFNETLITGEDYDLCSRVKPFAPVILNSDIGAIHLGNPKTLYQMLKREIWHGLGGVYLYRNGKINKPMCGALIFLLGTILQIAGLLTLVQGEKNHLFLAGTLLLLFSLFSTLYLRRSYIKTLKEALQMLVLYYVFYIGRLLSILFLIFKKDYYHNIEK